MCGIAGIVRFDGEPVFEHEVRAMCQMLVHRGPDEEGVYLGSGVGLGMRRLSIIDLEGGSQPIWNENESIGVVFNGEIYNYLELRRELIAGGHEFRTHTDTEVLVHLYEQLGDAMFAKLRGMFAFALIDTNKNRLLIARDHFGQKPLYYTASGDRLAFASELKSLLTLPWVSKETDPEAFLDYVSWLSLPSPRTHFRHIRKLPAGCFLSLPLHGLQSFEPHPTLSVSRSTCRPRR